MKKRILAVLLSFCVAGGSILCPSEARAEEAGTQPASYMDAKGYEIGRASCRERV